MSATLLIPGFRRALVALVAACALVLAAPALAGNGNGNGNGNGCNAPGNAYGHDNCDPPAPPPPPPPDGDAAPPASEEAPPAGETPPAEEPSAPDSEPLPAQPDESGDAPAPPVTDAPAPPAETPAAPPPTESASVSPPPLPPAPNPGPPAAGWAPVTGREDRPEEKPAPNPTARSGRTFSSTSAPEASWGASEPNASWSASQPDARQYGVTGTGAVITIRRGHGVFGGLSFRVSMTPGASSYVFRAARSVVAGSGGRRYRIGAWLRSTAPGITVCMRIQEVSADDPLTSVRTSESCLSPGKQWKKFRAFRTTLARGNRLVFSIYSFGAVAGDSFEVDGFTVERKVAKGWKRVDAAFSDAPSD
jgi:hypothetical protein